MISPEILLIDDDAHASVLRKRVLETKGYRVQIALDGHSGIVLANAMKPALVCLDHHIPPSSGPEVLSQLRALLPDTPVIVLSGYSFLGKEYDPQPDAFLLKGDSVQAFLRTVAELLPEQR